MWLDVPFVKQSKEGCGSAAISMILQYWKAHGTRIDDKRADAKAIQEQLYSPSDRGIRASAMEQYLKESGFRVFPINGNWNDIKEQLKQGRPMIVSLQPKSGDPLHYAVLTGIDWEKDAVFLHDPARGQLLRIERAEFEREWRARQNWMLLAVPEKAA